MCEPQKRRPFPLLLALVLATICVTGCGSTVADSVWSTTEDSTGERVEVSDSGALVWCEGDYGVVLAHGAAYDAASWEEQARQISESGMVALAPEDASPNNLLASVEYLEGERVVRGVALVGASAGGSAALRVAAQDPGAVNQLVLLSATGDIAGLGEEPKLFVASEGEGMVGEGEGMVGEVRRMAEEAPGDRNEALVLTGDAQEIFGTGEGDGLMQAILEGLGERG